MSDKLRELKTAKEFFVDLHQSGVLDDITCNPNPDYSVAFFEAIYRVMTDFRNTRPDSTELETCKWERYEDNPFDEFQFKPECQGGKIYYRMWGKYCPECGKLIEEV